MFQIIKFCDLTAEQVTALDQVLTSSEIRTKQRYIWHDGEGRHHESPVPFAKRLRVKGNKTGKYMYELEIISVIEVRRRITGCDGVVQRETVQCPQRVIDAICGAIGFYAKTEPSYAVLL